MSLTVGELKELLEGIDDDVEVRLAHQPSWPLEYAAETVEEVTLYEVACCPRCGVEGAVLLSGDAEHDECETPEWVPEETGSVLYVAEGSQLGYLPGEVSRRLGWR